MKMHNASCKHCNAWFKDELNHRVIKFTCAAQLELHQRSGKCFNWKTPVNYLWIGLPKSDYLPLSGDYLMPSYSGESGNSIFRPLGQLPNLYWN